MDKQIILKRLKEKGLRTTPQRIILFHKLMQMHGHIKAEDLYNAVKEDIPSISISTVYRTLREFEENGFIYSLPSSVDYGLTIFDTNLDPHHHFICKSCGQIFDIPADGVDIKLKNVKGEIELKTVVIKGVCESCTKRKKRLQSFS